MTVNFYLAKKQNLSDERVKMIESVHEVRNDVFALMKKLDPEKDKNTLNKLDKMCNKIEFHLQNLWGFEKNGYYHRFWDRPHCTCPKMDNNERVGTKWTIIAENCPLHGNGRY